MNTTICMQDIAESFLKYYSETAFQPCSCTIEGFPEETQGVLASDCIFNGPGERTVIFDLKLPNFEEGNTSRHLVLSDSEHVLYVRCDDDACGLDFVSVYALERALGSAKEQQFIDAALSHICTCALEPLRDFVDATKKFGHPMTIQMLSSLARFSDINPLPASTPA